MPIKMFICLALLTTIAGHDLNDLIPKVEPNTFHILNVVEQQKDTAKDSIEKEESGRQQRIAISTNFTTNLANKNETDKVNKTVENYAMIASSSQVMQSRPFSQYEVTEKVIDIPNTRTPPGPIVPNYTVRPALNIAVPATNNNTVRPSESPNVQDNIQTKKNKFSILHVNAEFDDKPNEVHENKVTGLLKGIKDYLQNIHKGIYNGIHRFFHKHDDTHGRFKREAEKEVVKVV